MRLREIQKITNENIKNLEIKVGNLSNGQFQISNLQIVLNAIKSLSNIKALSSIVDTIKKQSVIFTNTSDSVIFDNGIYTKFAESLSILKSKCILLSELLDDILPEQNELSYSICLPSRNFSDLERNLKKLHLILEQTLNHPEIDGGYEIQNYDIGSLWTEIVLKGSVSYLLVGSLLWSTGVIRKKYLEGELLQTQLNSLKIETEAKEKVKQAFEKELDLLIELEAKYIQNEHFSSEDNEHLSRIKVTLKFLNEMLHEGADFKQAIYPPEETKNLIPNFDSLETITSKVKLLDNNTGN